MKPTTCAAAASWTLMLWPGSSLGQLLKTVRSSSLGFFFFFFVNRFWVFFFWSTLCPHCRTPLNLLRLCSQSVSDWMNQSAACFRPHICPLVAFPIKIASWPNLDPFSTGDTYRCWTEQHRVIGDGEGKDLRLHRLQHPPDPCNPTPSLCLLNLRASTDFHWVESKQEKTARLQVFLFCFFLSLLLRRWVFLEGRESTESHQSQHQLGVAVGTNFKMFVVSRIDLQLM